MHTVNEMPGRARSNTGNTHIPTSAPEAPRSPRNAFGRPRLIDALWRFRSGDRQLVTLWAPAGAGKSTLIDQWRTALSTIGVPTALGSAEELAAGTAALTGGEGPGTDEERWLFVDDVDGGPAGRSVEPLVRLLAGLPASTRVVLAGRYEPSGFAAVVDAARGRAVLPNRELAFTVGETLDLADSFGIRIDADDASSLVDRTAGWAAGIALAMPYLASRPDPGAAIRQFDGDQHQVTDYLVVRVLDALEAPDRDVLMRAAVGVHVPLALAVALTGRTDVGAVLGRLSDRNVLVEATHAVDEFRFHPILASYMRAEFRRRDAAAAITNHAAAASWYEENGDHESAIEQALLTADRTVIAHQVERSGAALLMQGRSAGVARAMHVLANHPVSLPIAVIRLGMDIPSFPDRIGAEEQMATMVRLLAASSPEVVRQWRPMVMAISAFMVESPEQAAVRLEELGEFMRTTPIESLDAALAIRSAIAWCLVEAGHVEDAEPLLRSLQAASLRAGYAWVYLIATDVLASLAARAGDWRTASLLEQRMGELSFDAGPPYNRATARTALVTTAYAFERCEPVSFASIHQIEAADPTGSDLGLLFHARSLLLAAALDASAAPRDPLSQLSQLVRADGHHHPRVVATVAPRLVMWSLALHGPAHAAELRRALADILGPNSLETRMLRLAAETRGDYAAEHAVAEALADDRSAWTGTSVVMSHLLLASRARTDGRATEARDRVRRALSLAEEFGYAREFLAVAGFGARLVHEHRGSYGSLEPYAAHVLERVAAAGFAVCDEAPSTVVALTPKELELLQELPAHQTVAEIAAKHHLSANTIKTHLRSIYAKLGVSGRTEAVTVARSTGML